MSDSQPAEWRPISRPSPLYDELPKGWLAFDDAVENAGWLSYGPAWTGREHIARDSEAAALSEINALSDQELARENHRRLKLIDKFARLRRARLAAEAPQGGSVRVRPRDPSGTEIPEAVIAEAIERERAAAREALEKSQTETGRAAAQQRMYELTRECLEHRASNGWRPHRERWDEARQQLGRGIGAGKIATAVWLTPSKRLMPLPADEARTRLPAPHEGSRVKFDGEPGWLVVSEEDIDRVFGPSGAKMADPPAPASSPEPSAAQEGGERRPGRPSIMKKIREEMCRRAQVQPPELCTSMRAEGFALHAWAKEKFKQNAPTAGTIRTDPETVKLYKELKAGLSHGIETMWKNN